MILASIKNCKYIHNSMHSEDIQTPFHLQNNICFLKNFLSEFPSRILEIGCYRGASTSIWLDHFLTDTGTIVCIDPFNVSDEDPFGQSILNSDTATEDEFKRVIDKHRKPNQTVYLKKNRSYHALAELIHENQTFDLIYIDGNHTAASVITDACMSFGLLKQNGILLFDDFFLRNHIGVNGQPQDFLDFPKFGIDSFTSLFHKNIEILFINDQYALRKW